MDINIHLCATCSRGPWDRCPLNFDNQGQPRLSAQGGLSTCEEYTPQGGDSHENPPSAE